MLALSAVVIVGWLIASTIGTWAYFAGKSETESNFALPKFVSKP